MKPSFTIMFFGWRRRLHTSRTVVFLDTPSSVSPNSGVLPVIGKCNKGSGVRRAINSFKLLFMNPGYLKVDVEACMMVETKPLTWSTSGIMMYSMMIL